jgi:hypothetical protein
MLGAPGPITLASFASGYEVGLIVAAATSIGGAFTASITPAPAKAGGSGGAWKAWNSTRFDIS